MSALHRYRIRTLQALVVLLPVHAVSAQVGFSLKPWFLPLGVLLVIDAPNIVRRLRALPRSVLAGWALTFLGAVAGAVAGPAPIVAGRHVAALGVVLLVVLVWPDAEAVPSAAIGGALRLAGLLIVVSALLESASLLSGTFVRPLLVGVPGMVEPVASVIYGDILVPHGLHVDSNFLALHAVVILFLLQAFPSKRSTTLRDAALCGLLGLTVLVAFSRSGFLALVVCGAAYVVQRRRDFRQLVGPLAMAAVTMLIGATLLIVVDVADGEAHIEYSVSKRVVQTVAESSGLFAGLIDADAASTVFDTDLGEYVEWSPPRSELWAAYLEAGLAHPLTGIGFGVGSVEFVDYAHNALLESFTGGGVVALAGLLLMWAGAVHHAGWSGDRRHVALGGAVFAFLVVSMFLTTNYSPLGGMLLGMIVRVSVTSPDPSPHGHGRRAWRELVAYRAAASSRAVVNLVRST